MKKSSMHQFIHGPEDEKKRAAKLEKEWKKQIADRIVANAIAASTTTTEQYFAQRKEVLNALRESHETIKSVLRCTEDVSRLAAAMMKVAQAIQAKHDHSEVTIEAKEAKITVKS